VINIHELFHLVSPHQWGLLCFSCLPFPSLLFAQAPPMGKHRGEGGAEGCHRSPKGCLRKGGGGVATAFEGDSNPSQRLGHRKGVLSMLRTTQEHAPNQRPIGHPRIKARPPGLQTEVQTSAHWTIASHIFFPIQRPPPRVRKDGPRVGD